MQNQEKIIQAIAAIIAKNTLGISAQHKKYVQEVAAEIYAAIAPHMEAGAGWEDAPGWAEWRTVDNDGDVTFWEYKPVCSLLGFWLQSSDGGRFETIPLVRKLQQRPR